MLMKKFLLMFTLMLFAMFAVVSPASAGDTFCGYADVVSATPVAMATDDTDPGVSPVCNSPGKSLNMACNSDSKILESRFSAIVNPRHLLANLRIPNITVSLRQTDTWQ